MTCDYRDIVLSKRIFLISSPFLVSMCRPVALRLVLFVSSPIPSIRLRLVITHCLSVIPFLLIYLPCGYPAIPGPWATILHLLNFPFSICDKGPVLLVPIR